MATYTPLQPGQAASFGSSGDAVKALQTQLNAQNMGKPGYKPLKVDGLYGPMTQAASQFGSNIQNTGAYRQNTNANINEFDDYFGAGSVRNRAETISGDYSTDIDRVNSELTRYRKGLTKATGSLIDSIQGQFAIRKGQQEQITKGQVAGVRAGGYRTGANQVLQNYQADLVSEKERAGVQKLAELDAQEAQLVSEAEIAKLDKDYKSFNDAMDALRGIRKEKSATVSGIYKDALDYNKSLQDMELDRKRYDLDVAKENRLSGTGSSGMGIKFGQPDIKSLVGVGIPSGLLTSLQDNINKYGVEATLENSDFSEAQKAQIRNITKANGGDTGALTAQGLKSVFSSKSLKKASNSAGYSKTFRGKQKDIDAYVDYLINTQVPFYRKQGKTDEEIFAIIKKAVDEASKAD